MKLFSIAIAIAIASATLGVDHPESFNDIDALVPEEIQLTNQHDEITTPKPDITDKDLIAAYLSQAVYAMEDKSGDAFTIFFEKAKARGLGCKSDNDCEDAVTGVKADDVKVLMNKTFRFEADGVAYLVPDENNSILYLVFKGTSSAKDGLVDLNAARESLGPLNGKQDKEETFWAHRGNVNQYFKIAQAGGACPEQKGCSLAKHVLVDYIKGFKNKRPFGEIVITGHSLGGALSNIGFWDVHNHREELGDPKITHRSFASPRSLTQRVVDKLKDSIKLGDSTKRFVGQGDFVTSVPPATMGWSHIGQPYYLGGKYLGRKRAKYNRCSGNKKTSAVYRCEKDEDGKPYYMEKAFPLATDKNGRRFCGSVICPPDETCLNVPGHIQTWCGLTGKKPMLDRTRLKCEPLPKDFPYNQGGNHKGGKYSGWEGKIGLMWDNHNMFVYISRMFAVQGKMTTDDAPEWWGEQEVDMKGTKGKNCRTRKQKREAKRAKRANKKEQRKDRRDDRKEDREEKRKEKRKD